MLAIISASLYLGLSLQPLVIAPHGAALRLMRV